MTYWDELQAAEEAVRAAEIMFRAAVSSRDTLLTQAVKAGADVSQFNGEVNWTTYVGAGSQFVFTRVADGDVMDTLYAKSRLDSIRAAGLTFGPYYFGRTASTGNNFRNGRSEAAMAVYFAERQGWGKIGDLPLTYDFETLNGQTADVAAKHLIQFIKTYQVIKQHWPILYINPATYNTFKGSLTAEWKATLLKCPLWIAHWDVPTPDILDWPQWTFWQYTNKGTVAGIVNPCDLNYFSGSKTDLEALKIKE